MQVKELWLLGQHSYVTKAHFISAHKVRSYAVSHKHAPAYTAVMYQVSAMAMHALVTDRLIHQCGINYHVHQTYRFEDTKNTNIHHLIDN